VFVRLHFRIGLFLLSLTLGKSACIVRRLNSVVELLDQVKVETITALYAADLNLPQRWIILGLLDFFESLVDLQQITQANISAKVNKTVQVIAYICYRFLDLLLRTYTILLLLYGRLLLFFLLVFFRFISQGSSSTRCRTTHDFRYHH
jgi:hypothetical protein